MEYADGRRADGGMATGEMELDVDVEDRVHIVPLGYERDRVIVPPREMGADKVILVTHLHDAAEDYPSYYEDIFEIFEEYKIAVEEVECEIFELYDSLRAIAELIETHRDEEVYVNLATGSKVTAIAGMIACMVTEEAVPYYVSAEEYGDHTGAPVARKVSGISKMPTYPIDAPEHEQVRVLQHLEERGARSKRELIEFGEVEDLPFLRGYEGDNPKGKYRKLDAHIVRPLSENGYVSVRGRGQKKMVALTDEGTNTLHAFRYMIR